MKVEVGAFTYENGVLTGPVEYMAERGNARLDRILSGQDAVFNFGCTRAPSVEQAILVSLQTDYAGWKGMRGLCRGSRA